MKWLWWWFTDWFSREFVTYEERVIMLEQARRLKMKTDLQEQRIAKRLERQKRLEEGPQDFRTVAIWRPVFKRADVKCVATFHLRESIDKTVDGFRMRQVVAGPFVREDNGGVVQQKGELNAYFQGRSEYLFFVKPWHEWKKNTPELGKVDNITLVG